MAALIESSSLVPTRVPSRALYDDPIELLNGLRSAVAQDETDEVIESAERAFDALRNTAKIYSVDFRDVPKIKNATQAFVSQRISQASFDAFLETTIVATQKKERWPVYELELQEMLDSLNLGGLVDVIETRSKESRVRQTAEKMVYDVAYRRLEKQDFDMDSGSFFYFFNNLHIGTQEQRNEVLKAYLCKHPDIAQAPSPRFLIHFLDREETRMWRKDTLIDVLSLPALGEFPLILDAFRESDKNIFGLKVPAFLDGRTVAEVIDDCHPPAPGADVADS
jgi:hypothetical protein